MKAILVIDMPSDCYGCPCEYGGFCMIKLTKMESINKPTWCPLKPMPIKQDTKLAIGIDLVDGFKDGWNYGWNACLKEIENG